MRGLYIHIPFCKSKCRYCDFASFAGREQLMSEYTEHLISEAKLYEGMEFDTVYMGGGTPTALDADNLKKILNMIKSNFNLAPGYEFTVEANPGTVTEETALLLKNHGVNRISLGAQSFVDDELKKLGRIHTAQDTDNTFRLLRNCGFDNISLDLMFALPGQTMDSLSKSVERVLKLNPEHISCYGLKIEEGTPFALMERRGEICEKDEDEFADMYSYIVSALSENLYERYEISNFAKDGMVSRHNTKYWRCEEYLGLGLGASSYLEGRRFAKSASFDDYFDSFKLCEDVVLTDEDKMSEFVILGLRLIKDGISISKFKNTFGRDIYSVYGDVISKFDKLQMIEISGDTMRLTDRACYVSNAILCEFV